MFLEYDHYLIYYICIYSAVINIVSRDTLNKENPQSVYFAFLHKLNNK